MFAGESRGASPQQELFDRDRFLRMTRTLLADLRLEILKHRRSHALEELQMLGVWDLPISSRRKGVLKTLFAEFPELQTTFDLNSCSKKLCTLDNLKALAGEDGASEVARRFLDYFTSCAGKQWCVLVRAENLTFDGKFPELHAEGVPVTLRKLTEEERDLFSKLLKASLEPNEFFFAVEVQAGDGVKAVEKAREEINRFLAPFYLHRMLNPDEWWRARTQRNILSPVSFYYASHQEIGVRRELRQLRTNARELFFPTPEVSQHWRMAIYELLPVRNERTSSPSQLDRCLSICTRKMFAGETDEDVEDAFLKHCVAWEALLPPKIGNKKKAWYLLLLCISSVDPLCISTVSQGERLLDRRNGIAHAEEGRGLCNSVEQDLFRLKQSLRRAFDSALAIRQRAKKCQITLPDWGELLSRTFDCLCSRNPKQAVLQDDDVVGLLSDLHLLNKSANLVPGGPLSQEGCIAMVEALAVKARECWKDDHRGSVRHLARAYAEVKHRALPPPTWLHITLWVKRRLMEMDEQEFADAWVATGVKIPPPTMDDLETEIRIIERKHELRAADVGWVTSHQVV